MRKLSVTKKYLKNIRNGEKIIVQNSKNKEITVIDSKGNETTQIYPAKDNLEPTDSLAYQLEYQLNYQF